MSPGRQVKSYARPPLASPSLGGSGASSTPTRSHSSIGSAHCQAAQRRARRHDHMIPTYPVYYSHSGSNTSAAGGAVDLVRRQDATTGRSLVEGIDVVDRKVERLRACRWWHAAVGYVDDAEDDTATIEIVAGPRVALTVDTEEVAVELRGEFEVSDLDGDPKQPWGCAHWLVPFWWCADRTTAG